MKHQLINRFGFTFGAAVYDTLTRQAIWRSQIKLLLDHSTQKKPLRVLDLGTGPGVSAFALAEALPQGSLVVGVDLSEEMIRRAERHHRCQFSHLEGVSFRVADATTLPFDAGSFDLITGHSFLYLVPDPIAVLREARRALAPTGQLIFMEPSQEGTLPRALRQRFQIPALKDPPPGAARFMTSMVLWRFFSVLAGQLSREKITELFDDADFSSITCHETLGGLGWHCVATP